MSAWSLTGPYGMGQSSFSNYLLSLCGSTKNKNTKLAREMLVQENKTLFEKFEIVLKKRRIKSKEFFRVPVTSAFQPINLIFADEDIRVIILTGAGKTFCAGGDVKAMEEKSGMFTGDAEGLRRRYTKGIQKRSRLPTRPSTPLCLSGSQFEKI